MTFKLQFLFLPVLWQIFVLRPKENGSTNLKYQGNNIDSLERTLNIVRGKKIGIIGIEALLPAWRPATE